MSNLEDLKFKQYTDKNGVCITHCSMGNKEGDILALMAENISTNFKEPLFLEKSLVVSVPEPDENNRTEVSIWFSTNEAKDKMSSIIQKFFEWRFPHLSFEKNTTMQMQEPGKLTININ